MRRLTWIAIGLAALAIAACGGDHQITAAPTPGALNLTLNTATANGAALLFDVSGGAIDSIVPAAGFRLYPAQVGATFWRAVATGTLASGPIARVYVPDLSKAGNYSATAEQVADQSFALLSAGGYGLVLSR